ncbi:Ctnnbl1 [Symbiodinium sp. CCMP2592]|nr:Ctnnbl1 [Symbiodinium sp. CCMP2592]
MQEANAGVGEMRPPPVPVKRKAPAPKDEPTPKRLQLGDDLPDEVSREDIQHMLDKADELHVETLNETALKRMHLQFERKVKVNRELRIKHADDPDKFLKSEVDLDEEIKKFTLVATNPELYPALIKLETLPLMVGMLNHVNTDIAVDVFEVLSELTDPDAIADVEEPEVFLKALFEAQLCQMTVDVLMRIDETASDEDFKAVTNGLSMIENLADSMPQDTCKQFLEIPNFLPWLIKRVRAQGAMDYNKVYASEILGIVLQNSEPARESMVKLEGVDKLLRGIAAYRKRDPADSEESEYVQNMFDCLCSLMLLKANQLAFGRLQGLELMIRMMKEHSLGDRLGLLVSDHFSQIGGQTESAPNLAWLVRGQKALNSKPPTPESEAPKLEEERVFASNLALKLADHALRHCPENCQVFVEKLGLKVLFAIFMKRGAKTKKESEAKELEEHVTSIVQSLCRYCTGTPVARVLNKFVESQFEKLERLLEMHEEYNRSVKAADEARDQGLAQKIDREPLGLS